LVALVTARSEKSSTCEKPPADATSRAEAALGLGIAHAAVRHFYTLWGVFVNA